MSLRSVPSSWGRGRQGTEDLQHHRWPSCRLMDESLPPGSWNLLVTRRELTFHARTVPSTLHEYTLLVVWTHRSKCGSKSTVTLPTVQHPSKHHPRPWSGSLARNRGRGGDGFLRVPLLAPRCLLPALENCSTTAEASRARDPGREQAHCPSARSQSIPVSAASGCRRGVCVSQCHARPLHLLTVSHFQVSALC